MSAPAAPTPATHVLREVLGHARREDFAGYDPFDGLNSTLFQATPAAGSRLARLAWLQAFKLSPINFRVLAGIPKMRNPKGVALFVLGLLDHAEVACDGDELLAEARRLGDWLLGARVDRTLWDHSAWGYNFAWQARAFYVPEGVPNGIATCYAASALRRLGAATGDHRYTDAACDAGLFMEKHLLTRPVGEPAFFTYVPGEPALVHNANLWAAALVAETASELGDWALAERAYDAARHSVSHQRADGSWLYGTRGHHDFIDSFHTGYKLEALVRLGAALGTREFFPSIDAGYAYFVRTFVAKNGAVGYYAHNRWPEETHSAAQAVLTLLNVGGASDLPLADKVVEYAVRRLYRPRSASFIYRRTRYGTINIPYMRWSQAWAFRALAAYNRFAAPEQGA